MTFNFVRVNEVYIDNVINRLKNKSSSGYDNISNKHNKYLFIYLFIYFICKIYIAHYSQFNVL